MNRSARALLWGLFGLILAVLAAPDCARAQLSVSRNPTGAAPVLGTVVRGTSATIFSISTAGVVTKTTGNAIRLSSAAVTPPTISVYCGLSGACMSKDVRITVVVAGASGGGTIQKLRVGGLSGATYRTGAPVESASLSFDLKPIGALSTATFTLGMDVQVAAGAASGAATYTYTVTATLL